MTQNHQEVNTQFYVQDNCVYREFDLPYDLPEEDPMEFTPHGIDLSEVEVSDGGYYFERMDNDPYEYNPYRGGDWYQRAVYSDNSLVGRGPDRYYSVLLAAAFAQAMSIGLGRKVWVNPKALPERPDAEDLLKAWSKAIDSKRSSPIKEKRSMWPLPLMAWIETLSRSDAGMYLMACRKEYAMVKRMKYPPTGLLRALEFAGKRLKDRTLDFEEVV